MSYDIKFKQRAVEYQREGHTYKETCKVFKRSETTLTRWINKEKEGKLGEVKIQVRKPKKTNENTNGLLREFYPKRFDFSTITQNDLDVVVNIINNRPRKCLGYKTPAEVFVVT